jgi:hypothetical protein
MTILVSVIGLVARFAGAVLTTSLGWASTLLFGRVRSSHQIFVVWMLAGSLLWLFLLVGALAPGLPNIVLDLTPHPAFIDRSLVRLVLLMGLAIVPLGVGFAGYLVPGDGERPAGLRAAIEVLRGYLLTPVLAALMLFLPAVGISRKARSIRHRWSDTHIPIVAKPNAYDQLVDDLVHALRVAGLAVEATDAAAVLSLPALILTRIAGPNVRTLRADRLVELMGPSLRIGIYPSDIAISGPDEDRRRARAAVIRGLATAAAHLTTSSEAQAVEDRLDGLAQRASTGTGREGPGIRAAFAAIDRDMAELTIDPDEWDILYRLRLQTERDIVVGAGDGSEGAAAEPSMPASAPARVPAPARELASVATGIEAPPTT